MQLKIYTYNPRLVFDLLGKSAASVGDEVKISDQARLIYNGSEVRKAIGFPEIACFTLTFGLGVTTGVIANWLYDKLKGEKIEKLLIEKTEVQVDQGKIKKIIEEKIKFESK